jgi:hypothetical protein
MVRVLEHLEGADMKAKTKAEQFVGAILVRNKMVDSNLSAKELDEHFQTCGGTAWETDPRIKKAKHWRLSNSGQFYALHFDDGSYCCCIDRMVWIPEDKSYEISYKGDERFLMKIPHTLESWRKIWAMKRDLNEQYLLKIRGSCPSRERLARNGMTPKMVEMGMGLQYACHLRVYLEHKTISQRRKLKEKGKITKSYPKE